jgi:transposase-like protein
MSLKKKSKGQTAYGLEVKRSAVGRLERGESGSAIALELGCSRSAVYLWRDQWRQRGEEGLKHVEGGRRRRWPPSGSADREAALERLIGQQQAELDFFREALRRIEQAHRPTVEPGAPSPGRSSAPGRVVRKAG